MNAQKQGTFRLAALVPIIVLAFGLAGCGDDGNDGRDGAPGAAGTDGLNCWDLNQNGVRDLPAEDLNGDGVVDVNDCNALTSGGDLSDPAVFHKAFFVSNSFQDTDSCLSCHGDIGDDMLTKAHFTWQGIASNIAGVESERHGKNDIINNFCVAVPTNEGRCSQCHAGYGYADNTFTFSDRSTIDCLVCHDQTGTYAKAPTTAGLPDPAVDLQAVAQSVGENGGVPSRKNCIGCHANAGGGDNVKHGDLALALTDTTTEFDVHMGATRPDGTAGPDMSCVRCHAVKRDASGNVIDHGIGGMPYHSVDEGDMQSCEDCHGDRGNIHAGTTVQSILAFSAHDRLACQVCHIPTFARNTSTKVEWYWADAGQDIDPIPVDPATGRPTYDKKKGSFVWANNVRPTLKYHNGKWNKMMINVNDQYTTTPVVLGEPAADYTDPTAMIYPFKKMIGNQPADANNNTVLVPHLFGTKGGPNPYWAKYDWDLALQDGAAYTGQSYSGAYEFVDTVMYLTVNHEVAPSEQAYGMDGDCSDCHGDGQIDWTELGWSGDPVSGGTRP